MMRFSILLLSALLAVVSARSPGVCEFGRSFVDECRNNCQCMPSGRYACTRRGCPQGATSEKPLKCEVDGEIRVTRNTRYFCDRGIVRSEPVLGEESCQPNTAWKDDCNTCHCSQSGQIACTMMACLGPEQSGCTPGERWSVNGGCSECVCTLDGEPACTPCQREASASTVTCEDGFPTCPADCGQVYNAENDCYDCPCSTGRSGDITVRMGQDCPPGTDAREYGAFFIACAPYDELPQGNLRVCDANNRECPADCGLVRIAKNEGCVYCQCGPETGPNDIVIPIDQQCPSPMVFGQAGFATKTCKPPSREACIANTTYNVGCDICICLEGGKPACTKRDCEQEKYGDLQQCSDGAKECPADCGIVGHDSYCQFCQCGPRLQQGDLVVAIDQPCPPGTTHKATQFATKTCGKQQDTVKSCPHGPRYIDECLNECRCDSAGTGCTRRGCPPGAKSEKPLECPGPSDLPPASPGSRVFCHEGIVKVQDQEEPCLPGASFMQECNTCVCGENGAAGCTFKFCL